MMKVMLLSPAARLAALAIGLSAIATTAAAQEVLPAVGLAQRFDQRAEFEQCANACQVEVDAAISQCPGYREVLRPSDTSAPPPKCKRRAIETFERCMQRCPAPPTDNQG